MKRSHQPDEIWEAVEAEFYASGVADRERAHVNGIVKGFKQKGATASDVHRRAAAYRERWPSMPCTAEALFNNWDQFPPPAPKRKTRDEIDHDERERKIAALRNRRAVAQTIVDRYPDEERERAWKAYVDGLKMPTKAALGYLRMGPSLPEALADLLEPGKLDEMMNDEN